MADPDFFDLGDDEIMKVNPATLKDEGASAPSTTSEEAPIETETVVDEPAAPVDAPAVVDPSGSPAEEAPAAELTDTEKAAQAEGEDDKVEDEDDAAILARKAPPAPKPDKAKADADAAAAAEAAKTKTAPVVDPDKAAVTAPVVDAPAKTSKDMSQDELGAFFDAVMQPIKANGREIKLRTPEEAIRLMQMGAGYGRKVQEMQPHLKTLRMLEKNDLINPEKLSYLIELDKKNPEAIKKLIKDSGIDPLDLNMEDNADYQPVNHTPVDNEIALGEAIKEVQETTTGRETIQHIYEKWDETSKQFLWDNPSTLAIINEQRANGIYDAITAEIDRQRTLGMIPAKTPLLEAYKIAGDALVKAKGGPLGTDANPVTAAAAPTGQVDQPAVKQPIAVRTAAPKSQAPNNKQARAAAPTPASTRKAAEIINPLDVADDDFLKNFKL